MGKFNNKIVASERFTTIKTISWHTHGIKFDQLTPYQIRFTKGNQKIDYYLISGKYFNIQTKIWGVVSVYNIPYLFDPPEEINGNKSPKTHNKSELTITNKYMEDGYACFKRGWPDFCFFKDDEVFFVEVKKESEKKLPNGGLNSYQIKMIEILRKLGLDVRVEYA